MSLGAPDSYKQLSTEKFGKFLAVIVVGIDHVPSISYVQSKLAVKIQF